MYSIVNALRYNKPIKFSETSRYVTLFKRERRKYNNFKCGHIRHMKSYSSMDQKAKNMFLFTLNIPVIREYFKELFGED